MKNKILGLLLLVLAIVFCNKETTYFGNNMTAQSQAEWVCDTITLVLQVIGVYFLLRKSKPTDHISFFQKDK